MARRKARPGRRSLRFLPLLLVMAIIAVAGWQLRDIVREAIDPTPGETLVTTAEVNLRSGPGTGYPVLQVLPADLEVQQTGDTVLAFTPVDVDGERGWISAEWLSAPPSTGVVYASSYQTNALAKSEPTAEPAAPTVIPTEAPVMQPTAAPTEVPVVQPTVEPTVVPTAAPVYEPVLAESSEAEVAPQPGERWIEVDRTARTVTLHDGEIIVAEFDALIGKDPSADGYYSTAVGTYHVWVMEPALAETPFADGVYLTHFVGFDPDRSNGFHSPTRDAEGNVVYTGGQQTLGCVRLSEQDAITLFEFAHIGMRVEVHD